MRAALAILCVMAGAGMTIMLSLPGCSKEQPPPEKPEPFVNDFGQTVEKIEAESFESWLSKNKDKEIISITGISESPSTHMNPTTHYIIVYKKHEVRNGNASESSKPILIPDIPDPNAGSRSVKF